MSRENVLLHLLKLDQPLSQVFASMDQLPWDSDQDLVTLKAEHVISILGRFISGDLTAANIHDWADRIELREDIAIEPSPGDSLINIMFELANPEITTNLTLDHADSLLKKLALPRAN
jgi:hypothetical protein